ncbi:hypothetical protein PQX77_012227 [Marasmius sp. AFHP31]|nr:hypothetical protein PQX77_012227 [Marasmius sp. AFHP31]
MKIRYPFVLTTNCLSIKISQGLSVAEIPDTVTQDQQVNFTWFRASNDPTMFFLGYTSLGAALPDIFMVTIARNDQTEGILTVTFGDVGIVLMIGFNTITDSSMPTPFFEDKHPITVLGTGALPPVAPTSTSDMKPQQDSSIISKTPIASVTPNISNTASGSGSNGEMRPPSSITTDVASSSLKSKVNPGVVTGMVMGVFTLLLSVGLAWYFTRKKKQSATRTEPSGNLHPSPFPLPDTLNALSDEKQPRCSGDRLKRHSRARAG